MVIQWICNPLMGVRFSPRAPRISMKTNIFLSILSLICFIFWLSVSAISILYFSDFNNFRIFDWLLGFFSGSFLVFALILNRNDNERNR